MPRSKTPDASKARKAAKKPIEQYEHTDKRRVNNPPVGLVKAENDPEEGKKAYAFDPHLDPQLVWAGKAEHTSFEVPTVSLHVHERIDPKTILAAARKVNGDAARAGAQMSLFQAPAENPPLREALDFYKHPHGWSNRLVAGDSLLVMSSLLEKEGMAGKVQMVYLDPPYGIRYGSNFQPFVNKRDVKDRKDEDLTQEPEMLRAFRDTWELEIHSYLTYLRDRLLLARELLHESGSIFVQIGDENVHRARVLLDEVFGAKNFSAQITYRTSVPLSSAGLGSVSDHLLWYARDKRLQRFHDLFVDRETGEKSRYSNVELADGTRRTLTRPERDGSTEPPAGARPYSLMDLASSGYTETCIFDFEYNGKTYRTSSGKSWKTTKDGMRRLAWARRINDSGKTIRYVIYLDDFPFMKLSNLWSDTTGELDKDFAVQTHTKIIERCVLMTTDPGDLIFDPTCGSGTTAFVGEQWGRRWIACDTSRVAIALARQRLMTALYDYYELAHAEEGVGSGFVYKTVPHVSLNNIANNPEIQEGMTRAQIDATNAKYADQKTLYDQPNRDKGKARVTGPFTVEAVPAPVVKPLDAAEETATQHEADPSAARSGETLRHAEWREELLKSGIRGKLGQRILFFRVEPLAGTRWLHAEAETKANDAGADRIADPAAAYGGQRAVISFGPEHAPLEQKQVERAWHEAGSLVPKPALLVFAAFQFDPEAAKDIDELTPSRAGMTLLKVQMNPDMLTADLKKKRASNESFWLVGQPDVELRRVTAGEHEGKWQVEVRGFDYYNTKSGQVDSGAADRIALWMLDPDYDDRSLFPRQVFFPMAGADEGWARLAKSLRAEIDETAIEAYRGTLSLPFAGKPGQKIAVKVVDDRGIESLRILEID